jgi:hypothetical protein
LAGERGESWGIETGSVFGWGKLRGSALRVREDDSRRGSTSLTDHLGWRAAKDKTEECMLRKMNTSLGWDDLVVRMDGRA